jgi:hypothetical protein
MGKIMSLRAITTAALLGVTAVCPAPPPAAADGAGRPTGPVETAPQIFDGNDKVIGPVLGFATVGGKLGLTNDQEDVVAVTVLRVAGQVVSLGVAKDHFMTGPFFTTVLATPPLGVASPAYGIAYATADCTGDPYLLAVLNAPLTVVPFAPAVGKRAAMGLDGKLYVENGAQVLIDLGSFFDAVRESCVPQATSAAPVLPAVLLADLDELFVPPFTVR